MIRTQVSLSALEYRKAKEAAKKSGISLAELLRRSLRGLFPVAQDKPWMKYAGFVESGNKNSSSEVDDIIYGQKT
ncbi:MAG TPA: hypothetical protein DDW49_05920 [Deltaproteobacteria bacterium]|nr:hypothetical protein [Deltaproteobacteria bacterium]